MFFWFKRPLFRQKIVLQISRGEDRLNTLRREFKFKVRILPGQIVTPGLLGIVPSSSLYRMYGYTPIAHAMSLSPDGNQIDIIHFEINLSPETIPHRDMVELEKIGWETMMPIYSGNVSSIFL